MGKFENDRFFIVVRYGKKPHGRFKNTSVYRTIQTYLAKITEKTPFSSRLLCKFG